jgi:RNA polymerase sigma-70 factor (ECF subfamily)
VHRPLLPAAEAALLDPSVRGSWQQLSDRLGVFIARRVRPEDVDDVRQDVLLRIHTSARDLDDASRFGPWVYAIARNAVIDRLRRKSIADGELTFDPPAEPSAEGVEPPLLNCVTPFVSRLPAAYREAITLTELHGLSQQEAADIVGISLSGMKSRVQRGRKLLREMFEDCCHLTLDGRGRVIETRVRSGCQPPAGSREP